MLTKLIAYTLVAIFFILLIASVLLLLGLGLGIIIKIAGWVLLL